MGTTRRESIVLQDADEVPDNWLNWLATAGDGADHQNTDQDAESSNAGVYLYLACGRETIRETRSSPSSTESVSFPNRPGARVRHPCHQCLRCGGRLLGHRCSTRTDQSHQLIPWTLLDDEPPAGPVRYYSPLALIHWKLIDEVDGRGSIRRWKAPSMTGRPELHNLQRGTSCCTFTVGDGVLTHGQFNDVQKAIDALPEDGGKICLLEGEHQGFCIAGRHNILVVGCGPRTKVVSPPDQPLIRLTDTPYPDPLIKICASHDIELRDFKVTATSAVGVQIQNERPGDTYRVKIDRLKFHATGAPIGTHSESTPNGSEAPVTSPRARSLANAVTSSRFKDVAFLPTTMR